ncbi:MAG: hypothetical protein JWQ89_1806, partial [Devosia sp.]|nr:hypothetical protein [Devosia sp.]
KGNVLSQAITDTSSSPHTTRTWQWTWNPQGLAATETAPNGGVARLEYDARGNMVKSIDALGDQTRYGYDSANRMTATVLPNGLFIIYTWDLRGRFLTRTVNGRQTTAFTYAATGLLDTLTLPTGLVLSYTYDAAHRLTGWRNNRGESGTFTLERMRIDPGHVDPRTGQPYNNPRAADPHVHGYDDNGNKIRDPLAGNDPHFPIKP